MTARKISPVYDVFVREQSKGQVYRERGRWRWSGVNRGVETFRRGATLQDVLDHIQRVCRADQINVKVILRDPSLKIRFQERAQDIVYMMIDNKDSALIRSEIIDALHWARQLNRL